MGGILVEAGRIVAGALWVLATILLPPVGALLIGQGENPWVAFGLGIPFILLVFFTRKQLRFVVAIAAALQVASGLADDNLRLVLAASFLLACLGAIWVFRGRFGETLPGGDNRPTSRPTDFAGSP
jgi:hypothetical protein